MANKKKNNKQKKKKAQVAVPAPANVTGNVNKTPRVVARVPRAAPKSHVKKTCSIFNPFCPEALGARLPDGQSRTFTAQGRGTFTMATGATGGLASCAICPMATVGYTNNSPLTFPSSPAGLTEFAGLDAAGSLFGTQGDTYRVVSAGFILRAIQNASSAQGYFTLQTQHDFTPGTSTIGGNFLAIDNSTTGNYPGMEISYIFKPVNKVVSRQFVAKQSSTADPSTTGWPTAVVFFQGGNTAAAANVAIVEYFINIEFTFKNASTLAPLLPPPEPVHPPALMALSTVQTQSPAVYKGGVDFVEGKVTEAVDWAIKHPKEAFTMAWTGLDEMMALLPVL